MLSGIVNWCRHLGCHLELSSEITHSPFYLLIENFIHSMVLTNIAHRYFPLVYYSLQKYEVL
jgi:Rieske Fe-S protein